MKYYCNPLNIDYLYQYNKNLKKGGTIEISREAADPSMILYQGKYYLFASMTLGVWVSDDMVQWSYHQLPAELPLYDYAPDVREIDGYVYFSASKAEEICDFYRTKDILNGPYEKIAGSFAFWDPNLFQDEDGKCYLYWGCSSSEPIQGVEVDRKTLRPIGEKLALITEDVTEKGFERKGDDHSILPLSEAELDSKFEEFLNKQGATETDISPEMKPIILSMLNQKPYIEGAWMTKYKDTYYLQYAAPGTQYTTYADAVYISGHPLGPFRLAKNNPYSYKPGGFINGAGHGSTMVDRAGNYWHSSTMSISINHQFERRLGIWPAGFDTDGELFSNQQFGDWPRKIIDGKMDPWQEPEWFLLSYKKEVTASSAVSDKGPEKVTDENVRSWWQANTATPGEWVVVDLGKMQDVRAIQVNFADDQINREIPGELVGDSMPKYIDNTPLYTRYLLEGSTDGQNYFLIEDKTQAETNLPHDFLVREEGLDVRYVKLTIVEIPYAEKACVSGLRVFGKGDGDKASVSSFEVEKLGDLDVKVMIKQDNAIGHNIIWGHQAEKLYHSFLTYNREEKIGAIIKNQTIYLRVDSFNENGVTTGKTVKIEQNGAVSDL